LVRRPFRLRVAREIRSSPLDKSALDTALNTERRTIGGRRGKPALK
jgi:hypothetical protein